MEEFGKICKFVRGPFGGALKKNIFVKNGYAVYEQSHAIYQNFNSFRYYITEAKYKELKRFSVLPNDIIMSCSGTMGKFAVIPRKPKKGVINQALLKLTVNEGFDLEFMKFTLELPITQEKLLSQSAGGAIKNIVGVGQLKEIGICIPKDPKEQQKIANCLSSIDELITAHTQKHDALKAHKKGLMQQLFPAEGLRFPEFRDAGEWEEYSVNQLVAENVLYAPKDGNHGNIHPKSSDYINYGIPFIMANDIRNGKINYSKCSHLSKELADSLQKGFAKEGDVLLTHKGTVGEVVVIKAIEFPYLMLTPQVTYYRIKNKKRLLNEFLAACFISDGFQRNLLVVSGGGTRAYIGITEQGKLKIIIPAQIQEQQKIADFLSFLDEIITAQAKKIESLKAHKKGLMQQLFPTTNDDSMDAEGRATQDAKAEASA